MSRVQSLRGTASLIALLIPVAAWGQAAPSAFTTGYRYDAGGRQTGVILPKPDPSGTINYAATRSTYDADGNVVTVEKGELATWQDDTIYPVNWTGFTVFEVQTTAYDSQGKKIRTSVGTTSATYQVTQYGYDSYDRLQCTAVRMNPAVFGALPSDACTQGTQGSQGPDRITKNTYLTPFGQVGTVTRGVGTPLEQAYATYTYGTTLGDLDLPTSLTDANGNKTTMVYGGSVFNKITQMTFPSKTTPGAVNASDYEAYTYDANGNRLTLRKRDGSVINYSYDALNRNTVKDMPGGTAADVYYGYDLRGLQTYARFVSNSGAGITNAYDGFGRQTSTTNNMGGTARTLSYQWDENGNRTRVTYPDGHYAGYHYDGLDRFDTAGIDAVSGLIRRTYNAEGRLYASTSGSITYYSYDGIGRLTLQNETAGGTANVQRGFAYNPASQIVSRSISNDAYAFTSYVTRSVSYAPNGLNQYSTVAVNAGSPSTYSYDANGNLTGDGGATYNYDVENRLISTSAGTNLIYDPLGRLYETNVSGGSATRFLYAGDELAAEFNTSGTMTKRYVHGPGEDDPLAWFDGAAIGGSWSNAHLAKPDQQGSLTLWTDWNGGTPQINSYDEYGVPAASNVGRFQYTGQAWIPELGMYYYKARIYSPILGRFMQTDPVGYKDQNNLYAYVGNDPLNGRDPTGLYTCVDKRACDIFEKLRPVLVRQIVRLEHSSSEYERSVGALERTALDGFGKRDEDNGISVDVNTEKGAKWHSSNDTLSIDPDSFNYASLMRQVGYIAHELTHYVQDGAGEISLRNTLNNEIQAYFNQAFVEHGLGNTLLWSGSGPNWKKIRDSARISCGMDLDMDNWKLCR